MLHDWCGIAFELLVIPAMDAIFKEFWNQFLRFVDSQS